MPKEERKVLLAYSLIKTCNLINLNLFTYYLYLFILCSDSKHAIRRLQAKHP